MIMLSKDIIMKIKVFCQQCKEWVEVVMGYSCWLCPNCNNFITTEEG